MRFFEKQLTEQYTEEYADFVAGLHKGYCPMRKFNDWLGADLCEVYDRLCDEGYLLSDGEYCIETAIETLYTQILAECDGNEKNALIKFLYDLVINANQELKRVLKNSAT